MRAKVDSGITALVSLPGFAVGAPHLPPERIIAGMEASTITSLGVEIGDALAESTIASFGRCS